MTVHSCLQPTAAVFFGWKRAVPDSCEIAPNEIILCKCIREVSALCRPAIGIGVLCVLEVWHIWGVVLFMGSHLAWGSGIGRRVGGSFERPTVKLWRDA